MINDNLLFYECISPTVGMHVRCQQSATKSTEEGTWGNAECYVKGKESASPPLKSTMILLREKLKFTAHELSKEIAEETLAACDDADVRISSM